MDIWNTDTAISKIDGLDINIPHWIDDDITPADVAAIVQGGCASGAYMPAVTYYAALKTMQEHGDDVLQYIEDALGELPSPEKITYLIASLPTGPRVAGQGWSQMACTYLSCAVELWACSVESELEAFEPEAEEAAKARALKLVTGAA